MRTCSPQNSVPEEPIGLWLRFPFCREADRILDPLLNLFFPESCFICETPIAKRMYSGVCPDCLDKALALKIQPPFCPSCGLPMQNFEPGSVLLCVECVVTPPPYSGARSFGFYSGALASIVHGLKFRGKRNLAVPLSSLLVETFCENWGQGSFDLVIPIPLHAKRRRKRGYNQSELIARNLARRIGIPFKNRLLIRTRDSVSQIGLSDRQRRDNVKNAFSCMNPEHIREARVLLVDDVMTTGATVESASKTLIEGGVLSVSVLTLARTEM